DLVWLHAELALVVLRANAGLVSGLSVRSRPAPMIDLPRLGDDLLGAAHARDLLGGVRLALPVGDQRGHVGLDLRLEVRRDAAQLRQVLPGEQRRETDVASGGEQAS